MTNQPIVLAICGSTRQTSTNLNLIHQIGFLAEGKFKVRIYDRLLELSIFNPDIVDTLPISVIHFRDSIRAADAVLICTPEYAGGAPGVLKNLLDWSVSSMDFSQKPVALITASLAGKFTHQSLLGTLLTIESRIVQSSQLLIPMIRSKLSPEGTITDELTKHNIIQLIDALHSMIVDPDQQEFLVAAPLM